MNVTKCENEHYYDSDKYSVCPHCGAKAMSENGEVADKAKPEKKSHKFLWGKKETNEIEIAKVPDRTIGRTFGIFGDSGGAADNEQGENENPEDCFSEDSMSGVTGVETINEHDSDEEKIPEETSPFEGGDEHKNIGNTDVSVQTGEGKTEKSSDLAHEINMVAGDKTIGFFHVANSDEKSEKEPICDPPVGWLVCIKGHHFGESFNIYAGRNSVGRSENNRIAVTGEKTVSREKHAWITYEPKKRQFFIQPGEGTGLIYLNGENIMAVHLLNSGDKLELGDGMFIFIPLCNEDFSWEDYMGN